MSDEEKIGEGLFNQKINELITLQKNDIIQKATNYFLTGNYQDAEDHLLTAYPESVFNEDSPALLLMGHIQMKLEQYESAIEYLRQALKVEKTNGYLIYDSIGMTYFFKSDYQNALQNFEDARNSSQNNFNCYYHIALCLETMLAIKLEQDVVKVTEDDKGGNDTKLAEIKQLREKIKESYTDALLINPNSYDVLLNLGTLNANEGLTSVAEKHYKKALSVCTTDWKIYINLAYLTMIEKEYKIAVDYFEKAISIIGEGVELKILIPYMHALFKVENWANLEKVCRKVLKLDKKNKKALIYLIKALKHNKKIDESNALLKKLKTKLKKVKMDNSIDQKDTTSQLALHYEAIKKKVKQHLKENKKLAKAANDALINKDKESKKLSDYSNIAKLDTDNINSFGFNEAEIKNLLQIYKTDENNVEALYNLGMINFKEEDFQKSEEFFTKVMKLDPSYKKASVCSCLGDINLLVYKKPKEALEFFQKSFEEENNELLQVKIGVCYELLEDNEKALEHYMNGYEINKEYPASIFHIGCIYDKQNSPEAMKWFEMAYEKEKENVEYLRKYGDILVRSKEKEHIEKGKIILEKGLDFFTGNVDIMSSLAIGYEKEGKLKEAINLLEQANNDESFFNNKSKIFQLASYYEKAKNFTKAVDYFKNVLVLDRNNIEALLHIGFIYKSCKEFVKSFKCFNQIIAKQPNNIYAHYGLGRLYQLMNDKDDEAIQHYLRCVQIDPNYNKANIQLGIIYLKIKKIEESLNYLQKVYQNNKKNALCLTCLGNIYIETKKYEEAEKYFTESLKIDPKNIGTNAGLGDTYYGMGKYEEAIAKYQAAIKLGGNIPEIYFNLGHCFYIKEKYDQAINNYIEALKLVKNTRHNYYYYLGNALVAGGRIKDGIKAYQAAIKLKSTKLNYYYVLGRTCCLDKEYTYAIKYLEKLIEALKKLSPEEKAKVCSERDALFLLFKCYSSLPTVDSAKCKNIINTLLKDEPKNIKYLDCLASLFEKTNQTFEAIQTYKKILKINPDNIDAKNNLQRLEVREDEGPKHKKKDKKDKDKKKHGH